MRGAHDHEIGLAALEITFELRRPASIPRAQEPVGERRRVRVSRASGTRERLDVAPTPSYPEARPFLFPSSAQTTIAQRAGPNAKLKDWRTPGY